MTYLAIANEEWNILTSLRTAFVLHDGKMPGTRGIELFLKYREYCKAPFIFDIPPPPH